MRGGGFHDAPLPGCRDGGGERERGQLARAPRVFARGRARRLRPAQAQSQPGCGWRAHVKSDIVSEEELDAINNNHHRFNQTDLSFHLKEYLDKHAESAGEANDAAEGSSGAAEDGYGDEDADSTESADSDTSEDASEDVARMRWRTLVRTTLARMLARTCR